MYFAKNVADFPFNSFGLVFSDCVVFYGVIYQMRQTHIR